MAKLPLEGVRIIDMTVVWSGPFAAYLLCDMGAEVIRVESLQRWDTLIRGMNLPIEKMRAHGATIPPEAGLWDTSRNWNTMARGKKSMTVDLTRPEGREVFYRLASKSDAFIENNALGVMDKLGIGYETLKQHNPELIMLSMPAFGMTGPYRRFRGYGANMEGVMGHGLLRGYADMDPTHNATILFSDAAAGSMAAFAVVAALYHKQRTGRGQLIDMAQSEAVAHAYSQAYMDYSMNGRVQSTYGNRDPSRTPQNVYRCAGEDDWLTISCGTDAEFRALCAVIGKRELADDPRFSDGLSRYRNQDALDAEIGAWTRTQDHIEAFYALQNAGVPAGPVMTADDIFADPHLKARDVWQDVNLKMIGTHTYLKPVIGKMSKTPLEIRRPAPTLGQDNDYVYKEVLGYSDDEYRWFIENDHAGTKYVFQHEAER
jgi:crotonobetainyl-CoA:carnitine CoA-transferase CaiB-like acyl-CoA transferase